MSATYTLTPSDDSALGTIIHRNGAALLITGLASDHPRQHNQLAAVLVRILSTPEVDVQIAAVLGEGQMRCLPTAGAQVSEVTTP